MDQLPLTGLIYILQHHFQQVSQITAAMISNALNVTPAAGDKYEFNGYSVGTDGSVVDFKTLAPDIAAESGQKQAYQYGHICSLSFCYR